MTGVFQMLLPYTGFLALFLRVWVGVNFVAHGYPKLGKSRQQTLQWTRSLGVPAVATYLAIILEFFGGLSLIIGFIVSIVGFFIALEMIGAIFLKKTKMKTLTFDLNQRSFLVSPLQRVLFFARQWHNVRNRAVAASNLASRQYELTILSALCYVLVAKEFSCCNT